MKPIFAPFGLPIGFSAAIWGTIGIIRYISERLFKQRPKRYSKKTKYKLSDLAVIIAAHNEQVGIIKTIRSLTRKLSPDQIYVASDGSIDNTARFARSTGCYVDELMPGRGKARALRHLLTTHNLFERYKLILICDADIRVDRYFLKRALVYFDDPEIAVVFAGTKIRWTNHIIPRLPWYFISYRDRLNRLLIFFYIYGQTWKHTNVNYVIPGSCTIYRSDILQQLPIDTPGLLIEDFNTAFQLYKRRLGKMAFHPSLIQWEHYPDNLRDYWRQVRRWNIGFLQTVRINGIWPSIFWLTLGLFNTEVWLNAFFILLLPFIVVFLIVSKLSPLHPFLATIASLYHGLGFYPHISLTSIFLGIYLWDYMVTVIVSFQQRKPQMLFYGFFFFFMHYVTVLILLSSLIPGLFMASSGRWTSPTRRRGV